MFAIYLDPDYETLEKYIIEHNVSLSYDWINSCSADDLSNEVAFRLFRSPYISFHIKGGTTRGFELQEGGN